jgi:hypothetical protein
METQNEKEEDQIIKIEEKSNNQESNPKEEKESKIDAKKEMKQIKTIEEKKDNRSKIKEDSQALKKLLGDFTDFKSELSPNEDNKDNDKAGDNYVEKYFNAKMKNQFGIDSFSNVTIKLQDILDEIILYLNEKALSLNKSFDVCFNIIRQLKGYFKDETQLEIDSLFPLVKGIKIKSLFETIENYSYPKLEKFNEKLSYTIIVESTFCLRSQIIKKSEQLRKSFLLFTIIHKFYENYKEYFQQYYDYFIKKYIYQKKIKEKAYDYEIKGENEIELSQFGNFIFLILSNSSLKLFEEVRDQTIKGNLNKDEIMLDIDKCFQFPLSTKYKYPLIKKEYLEDELKSKNDIVKYNKNDLLMDGYKKLHYLIDKINDEKNCKVKLIYLDTYINLFTPKNIIINKIDSMSENLKKIIDKDANMEKELKKTESLLNETNVKFNILLEFIKEKFPEFNLDKLISNSKIEA